jgi:hypothetical protein
MKISNPIKVPALMCICPILCRHLTRRTVKRGVPKPVTGGDHLSAERTNKVMVFLPSTAIHFQLPYRAQRRVRLTPAKRRYRERHIAEVGLEHPWQAAMSAHLNSF